MVTTVLLAVAVTPGAQKPFLWQDPGAVEELDLASGPGGPRLRPAPPFTFLSESDGGTTPKLEVRDAAGVVWRVKGGHETHSDPFVSRLVWACGYYADPIHFVSEGRIEGTRNLKRAHSMVKKDGSFHGLVFETTEPRYKYLPRYAWNWKQNPFAGTRELNGLKILVMLTSDWDNKDIRDFASDGSNTGMYLDRKSGKTIYYVNDWGESMGGWGHHNGFRPAWNCHAFQKQTPDFIKVADNGLVRFGFKGFHDEDFYDDITVEDIRWLLQYLGRISDRQLRTALTASGARDEDADCFTRELRARTEELKHVASQPTASSSVHR